MKQRVVVTIAINVDVAKSRKRDAVLAGMEMEGAAMNAVLDLSQFVVLEPTNGATVIDWKIENASIEEGA